VKEEVAEAVREKKKKYGNWKKEKSTDALKEYKMSKQNAKGLSPYQRQRNRRNVSVPCGRLSWFLLAIDCTLNPLLLTY